MHRQKHQLTIGAPDTPQVHGLLNAHLVVQLDDVIIDPTLEQVRRPWNDLPHIGAFVADVADGRWIDILPGCWVPVIAQGSVVKLGSGCQLSHFKLPRAVARSTRKWTASPDARPCRRREIAEAALAIARVSLMPSEAMAA